MNIHIMLNPERDGYKACPHCHGYGSSLKESHPTCSRCGGSGLIHHPSTLSAQATLSSTDTNTRLTALFPGEPDEA